MSVKDIFRAPPIPSPRDAFCFVFFFQYRVKNFVRDIRNVTHIRQDAGKWAVRSQYEIMKAIDNHETVNYRQLKDTGREVENINLALFLVQ